MRSGASLQRSLFRLVLPRSSPHRTPSPRLDLLLQTLNQAVCGCFCTLLKSRAFPRLLLNVGLGMAVGKSPQPTSGSFPAAVGLNTTKGNCVWWGET